MIKQQFIEVGTPPRSGYPLSELTSITIHWIGPYPKQSVQEPIRWWVKQKLQASAHFVIKDNMCINCIPIEETAWHSGVAEGNHTSIGIEVVPDDVEGRFSAASIETLKEVLSHLPDVPLLRHYDWTKKDCPRWYTPYTDGGAQHWEDLEGILRG
jgi:N-acetylmuramoyl-L-alanine amidase CwlA